MLQRRQKGWFECGVCWIILFNGHAISAVTLTRSSRSRWSSSSSTRSSWSSSSSTWSSSWPQWPGHLPVTLTRSLCARWPEWPIQSFWSRLFWGETKCDSGCLISFPYQELLKRWPSSQICMIRSKFRCLNNSKNKITINFIFSRADQMCFILHRSFFILILCICNL